MTYLGSRKCPTLLNELQDPARILLGGAGLHALSVRRSFSTIKQQNLNLKRDFPLIPQHREIAIITELLFSL